MAGVIVHEWIAQTGGSENVVQVMADIYPEADVVCLWNDSVGRFNPNKLHESWLARTPLRKSKALSVPFMPATWRRMPDRDYDFALVSSHLFAHHARFAGVPAARRFVYVHSPARYIWSPELDKRGAGLAARAMSTVLKPVDRKRARETKNFAVNSDFVRKRMEHSWGLPATTMYPPVQVTRIQSVADWSTRLDEVESAQLAALPAEFLLGASRFIPYKRLDEVIRAGEVSGIPVVLAGDGPLAAELKARAEIASVPVHIVPAPSSALLYALYQRCSAYVFPALEDFGIMPVEAMAAGAPVVANRVGGASESVVAGKTGALTDFECDDELRQAVEQAMSTVREDRLERARDFSVERFSSAITSWVGVS